MLLARASMRYLPRHPWQLTVAVLGIALGVAVMLAVDITNLSARRAFLASVDAVYGEATHQVIGGPTGLPETLYVDLRVRHGQRMSAPIIEGYAEIDGIALNLLGVDPFAEAAFRDYVLTEQNGGAALLELVARPGTVLLDRGTAARLGVAIGEQLVISVSGRSLGAELVGLLDQVAPDRPGLRDLILTDIATAQEWLQWQGRLTRIDLRLDPAGATTVAGLLPAGARLVASSARSRQTLDMTRSFNTSLAAMSLLAMLVGVFLIYNSISFAVVQRREIVGVLRALGVTRAEVGTVILAEATVLGLVGVGFGLLLGYLLAQQLLELVGRTINDHYFFLRVTGVSIAPWPLVKAIGAGLGATLVAAAVPSWEAAHAPPRLTLTHSFLERRARGALGWLALAGPAAALAGMLLIIGSETSLLAGFVGLFLVVVGLAFLVPGLVGWAGRWLGELGSAMGGAMTGMTLRGIARGLSRTGVAVTALAVAVAATLGVEIMVGSFRNSVSEWLERTLSADLYVSPPRLAAGRAERVIDPELLTELYALAGVEHVSASRSIQLETEAGMLRLLAVSMAPESRRGLRLTAGASETVWPAFERGEVVLISEPLAYHRGLRVGDTLMLPAAGGDVALRVGAIYQDFDSEQGVVLLDREHYRTHWNDDGLTSLGFYLAEGVSVAELSEQVRAVSAGRQSLLVTSNRDIRELSLQIFDRTFTITNVLYLLTVAVAFVGMFGALSALQMERVRELGVLRALGVTPGQLWGLTNLQTLALGMLAGLAALPLGLAMAWILLYVINRRAFGWLLEMQVEPVYLFRGILLAAGAALLAGLYPAWRMSRTQPALAMREE